MTEAVRQPHSVRISEQLLASLAEAVAPEAGAARPDRVVFHDAHSNDVAELRYADGRTLMVKRGRYDWTAPRFHASRLAAELLNRDAGVVAPAPLDVGVETGPRPIEAYWRVDLPTLQELWPTLAERDRAAALHSLGELVRRVHGVRVRGHGPLAVAEEKPSFAAFMHADLGYRLFPALSGEWPEALDVLERLRAAIADAAQRVPAEGSALLHNDLHMGNVLCEPGRVPRCVGLLDLETAFAGPVEADLAILEVHHGPLFTQPLDGRWLDHVHAGYGRPLDALLMRYFRTYHLLNMGFYSVIVGHAEHAGLVLAAARQEAAELPESRTAGS